MAHSTLQTTVHAFCNVFQPTQSEKEHREKAVAMHTVFAQSLARVQVSFHDPRHNSELQLNDSSTWTCDGAQSKIDAAVAARKVFQYVAWKVTRFSGRLTS